MKFLAFVLAYLVVLSSSAFALLADNSKITINNFIPGLTLPQANGLFLKNGSDAYLSSLYVGNLSVYGSFLNITVENYNVTGTITGENIYLNGYLNASDIQVRNNLYVSDNQQGYNGLADAWGFDLVYFGQAILDLINGYYWLPNGNIYVNNSYVENDLNVGEDLEMNGNIQIGGYINGINISNLNQSLDEYWKSDGSSTATGNWDLNSKNLKTTGTMSSNVFNATSKIQYSADANQYLQFSPTGFNLANDYLGSYNPVIQTFALPAFLINYIALGNSFYDTDVWINGLFKTAMSYDFGNDEFTFDSNQRQPDNIITYFGNAKDASIYYTTTGPDGLHIDPDLVNSADRLVVDGMLEVDPSQAASGAGVYIPFHVTATSGYYNAMQPYIYAQPTSTSSASYVGTSTESLMSSNYDLTGTYAIRGINSAVGFDQSASGDVTGAMGFHTVLIEDNSKYTGNIQNYYSLIARTAVTGGSQINITNFYGLYHKTINRPSANSTYGLYLEDVIGGDAYAIKTGAGKVSFGDTVYMDEINTSPSSTLRLYNDSGWASLEAHDVITHTFNKTSDTPLEGFTADTELYKTYTTIKDKSRPVEVEYQEENCFIPQEEVCHPIENCSYSFDGEYYHLDTCWNETICHMEDKKEIIGEECHMEEKWNYTDAGYNPERPPLFLGYEYICSPTYQQVIECYNITQTKITYPYTIEIEGESQGQLLADVKATMVDLNTNVNLYINTTDFDTDVMAESFKFQSKPVNPDVDYVSVFSDSVPFITKHASKYTETKSLPDKGDILVDDVESQIKDMQGYILINEFCRKNNKKYEDYNACMDSGTSLGDKVTSSPR